MPQLKNKKKLKKVAAKKKVLKAPKKTQARKGKKIIKQKAKVKAKKTIKPKKGAVKKTAKAKVKAKKTIKPKKSAVKKTAKAKKIVRVSQKKQANKPMFTSKEIKTVAKQLQELRASLANVVKTKKELDLVEHDTGDSIDIASQSLDKEMLFELSGNELAMLDDVDAAIRRIENGVYGLCEYCRKPIKKLRLKAIPQARYCLQCQSGNEGKKY